MRPASVRLQRRWGASRTVVEIHRLNDAGSVANYLVVSATGSSVGPTLKFGGSQVLANQFVGWTVVGAEAGGSGYQVVWQSGSQFSVWNVDSNATSSRRLP